VLTSNTIFCDICCFNSVLQPIYSSSSLQTLHHYRGECWFHGYPDIYHIFCANSESGPEANARNVQSIKLSCCCQLLWLVCGFSAHNGRYDNNSISKHKRTNHNNYSSYCYERYTVVFASLTIAVFLCYRKAITGYLYPPRIYCFHFCVSLCVSVCEHSVLLVWMGGMTYCLQEMYSTRAWKVDISVRTIYRWNLCFIGFLTI